MGNRKLYDGYSFKICKDKGLAQDLKQESFIRLIEKSIPVEKIYSDGEKALDVFFYAFMRNWFKSNAFKSRYELNRNITNHDNGTLINPMAYESEQTERNEVNDYAQKLVAEFLEYNIDDTKDSMYFKQLYNLYKEIGNVSEISRRTKIPVRTLFKDYATLRKMIKDKYEEFKK
jgi:DNA-directed RNA polymerase specialized sigma24 family protein